MGWPEIRYPDGTEIAPQLDLRVAARALRRRASGAGDSRHPAAAGRPARARHRPRASSANRPRACSPRAARAWSSDDREARDTMVITRAGSERVHDFAFRLARAAQARAAARGASPASTRPTCSVRWRSSAGSSTSAPRAFPDIEARHHYVDATALDLDPQAVGASTCSSPRTCSATSCPTRRAALVGGMGMAPSADIGDRHAPVPAVPRLRARHRRPGQGQSDRDDPVRRDDARLAARERHDDALARGGGAAARARRRRRVRRRARCVPFEFGGRDGTRAIADAVGVEPLRSRRWRSCASRASEPATSAGSSLEGWRDIAGRRVRRASCNRDAAKARRWPRRYGIPRRLRRSLDAHARRRAAGPASTSSRRRSRTRARARRRSRAASPTICQKPFGATYADAVAHHRARRARRRAAACPRELPLPAVVPRGEAADRRRRSGRAARHRVPAASRRRPGAARLPRPAAVLPARCRASWSSRRRSTGSTRSAS